MKGRLCLPTKSKTDNSKPLIPFLSFFLSLFFLQRLSLNLPLEIVSFDLAMCLIIMCLIITLQSENYVNFDDYYGASDCLSIDSSLALHKGRSLRNHSLTFSLLNRLIGLVVKASAAGAKDPGFESRLRQDFSGSSHTSDLKKWHSSGYHARRLAL